MTITTREYAYLSEDAYVNEKKGHHPGDTITIGQTPFKIEKQVSEKNGYQGTIYRNLSTGELVVAHRGTETKNLSEALKDGIIADGSMVLSRVNTQAQSAKNLTHEALQLANEPWTDKDKVRHVPGQHPPAVTVTGHSLGGTLAQITAHHFGLHGETFNAYGAVSLNHRIPEGNHAMINHVVGTDLVSAASQHYGEVRPYVTTQQIEQLHQHGFKNDHTAWSAVRQHTPIETAKALSMAKDTALSSHQMQNFLDRDAQTGKPTYSVLNPADHQRAIQYQDMLGHYRDRVQSIRRDITNAARGPKGLVQDAINEARGPVPAGKPADDENQAKHGADILHNTLTPFQAPLKPQTQSSVEPNGNASFSQQVAGLANPDVQALYAKLHDGLADKITRAGGEKWLESMLAGTTYACVKNGLNCNNIGYMDINIEKNNILVMSQDKNQFAVVNAREAARGDSHEQLHAATQLYDSMQQTVAVALSQERSVFGRSV